MLLSGARTRNAFVGSCFGLTSAFLLGASFASRSTPIPTSTAERRIMITIFNWAGIVHLCKYHKECQTFDKSERSLGILPVGLESLHASWTAVLEPAADHLHR